MNRNEAEGRLLDLHLAYHEESLAIRELVGSGISRDRILALYPLDFSAYASKLDRWLSNVPGGSYRNLELLLPFPIFRWRLESRINSRDSYKVSGHYERHQELLALHFPRNQRAKLKEFLLDLHDAIWLLANWEVAEGEVRSSAESRALLEKYVRTWSEHLMVQPSFVKKLQLDLR